jgi:hypothetical protein
MAGSKSITGIMKIKLVRNGGFVPVIKEAETEVSLTDKELTRLLDAIEPDPSTFRIKDGNYYEVKVGSSSRPVDLEKVPDEYKALFGKLKDNLKIVKQG